MKTLTNFCITLVISVLIFTIIFLSQVYFTNNNNIVLISIISFLPALATIITLTELLHKSK